MRVAGLSRMPAMCSHHHRTNCRRTNYRRTNYRRTDYYYHCYHDTHCRPDDCY